MKTEYFLIIVCLIYFVCLIFIALRPINEVWNNFIILKNEEDEMEKKNKAREGIRKESWKLFVYTFGGVICVALSIFMWKRIKVPPDLGEQELNLSEEESREYQEIKNKIVFDNEIINEDTTIWGQILTKKLGADDLEISLENAGDIETLRNDILIYDDVMSWEELEQFILDFDGAGIFPDTVRTVEEISADVAEMKEKIDNSEELPDELNPEEIYPEEFIARFNRYQVSPAIENLYQTARAADDAYKQLFKVKDAESKKKAIFYAVVTSNLYKIYVNECDSRNKSYEVDLSFIEYRLSELYIYLYRYYIGEENGSVKLQLILKADAHLEKAEQNFIQEHPDEDINEYLCYFDAYYAEIFYYYYTKTGDIQYAEKCREYSNRYLASKYAKEYEKSSCDDYLERIDKKQELYHEEY